MAAISYNGTPAFIKSHLMPAFRGWMTVKQGWKFRAPDQLTISLGLQAGFSADVSSSDPTVLLVTPDGTRPGIYRLDAFRPGFATLHMRVFSTVVGPHLTLDMNVDIVVGP